MRALYAKYGSGYPIEDFIAACGVVLVIGYLATVGFARWVELGGWLS